MHSINCNKIRIIGADLTDLLILVNINIERKRTKIVTDADVFEYQTKVLEHINKCRGKPIKSIYIYK